MDTPNKRSRLSKACHSCVTSKTRCDDITSKGCFLCRRRNKPCSLVVSHDRTGESLLHSSQDGLSSQRPSPSNDSNLFRGLGREHRPALIFEERLFSATSVSESPDPILRGLVTQDQVDMAFQSFKYRFSRLLPVGPFLQVSTPTPTDPFVIVAVLIHVPSIQVSSLPQLVEESLTHAMKGAVNLDTILALLILSLAPPIQAGKSTPPTALRMISFAYQVGFAMGLDGSTNLLDYVDLRDSWWKQKCEEIILWETVKSRYNLLHLLSSRCATLVTSDVSNLPDHPSYHIQECLTRLRAESALLAIFQTQIISLSRAESLLSVGSNAWEEICGLRESSLGKLQDVLQQSNSPLFNFDCLCVDFCLTVRTATLFQRIPTPISLHARGSTAQWLYPNYHDSASRLLSHWTHIPKSEIPFIPAYTLDIIMFAAISARRSAIITSKLAPANVIDGLDTLALAEDRLHELGGKLAETLSRLQSALAEWSQPSVATFDAPATEFFSQFDWGAFLPQANGDYSELHGLHDGL